MKVCLITNAHLSYNPRLLKEADALCEAGYETRVISVNNSSLREADDRRVLEQRKFKSVILNFQKKSLRGIWKWFCSGISVKLFSVFTKYMLRGGFAEKAYCRYGRETLKAAVQDPADLYIAHNLQSFPIAVKAAEAVGALCAFDFEDFHLDEDTGQMSDSPFMRLKGYIINKYIRACDYVSSTTEAMADALEGELRIERPRVLYNVFPLSYREGLLPPSERTPEIRHNSRVYTAYWYSQTVGLDRGLQDFMKAVPLINYSLEIYLRGDCGSEVRAYLLQMARQLKIDRCIHFLPPAFSEDLVKEAGRYDFGLTLEQPVSRNRLLTAPNKIFTYLLAGNAVIATDTPGQREVFQRAGSVGILYSPGNHEELAEKVNALLSDETELLRCKENSWTAGLKRFNWDIEKEKFLQTIKQVS